MGFTTWETALKGHSIRKVANHWSKQSPIEALLPGNSRVCAVDNTKHHIAQGQTVSKWYRRTDEIEFSQSGCRIEALASSLYCLSIHWVSSPVEALRSFKTVCLLSLWHCELKLPSDAMWTWHDSIWRHSGWDICLGGKCSATASLIQRMVMAMVSLYTFLLSKERKTCPDSIKYLLDNFRKVQLNSALGHSPQISSFIFWNASVLQEHLGHVHKKKAK